MGLWDTTKAILFDSTVGVWINPAFALGGAINQATGGTTTNWTTGQALFDNKPGTVFSQFSQTFSAYNPGADEADGRLGYWQLPIINKELPKLAADLVPKWVWVAGGVAAWLALTK